MSFLESLELVGFKSFAKRTVITFDSGITAVVGPNGSGKSNIADAIRWVLGAQSKKAVRGKAATDMIFSGTSQKAPMSLAEVSLTFDNSAKLLPYEYEEVVVTRRLYRSGDSEYLVNGAKVRLSDLQHAFAVAGIGAETYTVIGQGLVDQVLSQTPTQRRGLFEEAAGIRQFQIKRDEAKRKLTETGTNLGRVEDILRELEPRLKSLRRQVAGLAQRTEVESALTEAYLAKYGHRYRRLDAELRDARAHQADLDQEFAKVDAELQDVNARLAGLRERQQGLRLHQLLSERTKLQDRREVAAREIAEATTRLEVARHDLERTQRQRDDARSRLADLQSGTQAEGPVEPADLTQNLAAAERTVQQIDTEYAALQDRLAATERGPDTVAINHALQKLTKAVRGREPHEVLDRHLTELRDLLAALGPDAQNRIAVETRDVLTRRDTAQRALADLQVQQVRFTEARRLHQESLRRHEQEIAALTQQQTRLEQESTDLEARITAATARIAELSAERKQLEPELAKLEAAIQEEQQASLGDFEIIQAEDAKRTEKQRVLEEYRRELGAGNVAIAKLETKLEDLVAEATAKLGTAFPPTADTPLPEELRGDDAAVEKLERRLLELGGISPEVTAEHDEVAERYEFLSSQAADLTQAKTDLERLIAKLETQSRNVFRESFSQIGTEFASYFTKLFGGGSAELVLVQEATEEGSASEFGIEIKAQPPGKRVQSLAMLSGGERAMTSVALLFAILTVNPSPFVMLDEVDAALDEANTGRFAEVLGELSERTQFIVVTHNRDTMKAAQVLYGVTMDETGVSTMLSIKLPEAEAAVA